MKLIKKIIKSLFCVISHKKKHSAQCDLTTGKILNQVTNILIIIDFT